MDKLEEIYGIKIDNPVFFKRALTHPSYTKEKEIPYVENYERLEFLGDAVLKLITSQILYERYPDYTEGNLSKIRSIVVSDSTLSKIAHDIGLCELIIMARHEAKQGLANLESVCACAFEAVLGAYYLDNKLKKLKTGSAAFPTATIARAKNIENTTICLPDDITEESLLAKIDELNNDDNVDGILVQLPLPLHINKEHVIERIRLDKDVDGFHPLNVAALWQKREDTLYTKRNY